MENKNPSFIFSAKGGQVISSDHIYPPLLEGPAIREPEDPGASAGNIGTQN